MLIMSGDDAAATPRPAARAPVRHSAWVIRAICRRVAAGETLVAICRDADMPTRRTFGRWVRDNPKVAEMYARAKVFGDRTGRGRPSSYCPATAHEIVVRVSEGEPLSDIVEDPAMPSMRVVLYWQTTEAEFAEAIELARWAQAERLADLGWKMALEATPQTAHLTRVRLGQLRWSAGIKAPRTHGRMKAVEPPQPPDGPQVILFRHFKIEENFATGQHRVVSYRADTETMRPVRDHVGPWTTPVDPVKKTAAIQQAQLERLARERAAQEGFDPAEIGVGPEAEDDAQWL
jgi:hypothetical protein